MLHRYCKVAKVFHTISCTTVRAHAKVLLGSRRGSVSLEALILGLRLRLPVRLDGSCEHGRCSLIHRGLAPRSIGGP